VAKTVPGAFCPLSGEGKTMSASPEKSAKKKAVLERVAASADAQSFHTPQ
jgi:hypothetical protein